MALKYLANGNLEPGIYELSWEEFVEEYGYTYPRKFIISGLKVALHALKLCNCQKVYIDGSFTTKQDKPHDWDGCFDPEGIDEKRLENDYPVFGDLDHPRLQQKMLFKGEIFPSTTHANAEGETYFEWFQKDKKDDSPKGIILILLKNFNV